MKAPINPFKQALHDGKVVFGCWLGIPDTFAAEMIGHAGFDWVLIDGEHGPNDMRSTLHQLQMLAATDTHAIVRLPIGETHLIKQALDLGAQTLLIPMVESADEARELVRAVTYPPKGIRGVGYPVTRAARFGQMDEYGTTADAQISLLVQVENRAGMAALDDILAVDGIDGVFIGPADLAADMGHIGNPNHPEVYNTIMDALRRIRAAGKAPGILSLQDNMTNDALDAGAQFVAVGSDVAILSQGAQDIATKWQARKG